MSNSMLVRDEESKETPQATTPEPKIEAAPDRYIPISFCTQGKLSAPEKLHFRNYTLEEAAELSAMREENYLEKLITILNRMVWEDFDCVNLHTEELKEVMLNLRFNFWGKTLENMPFTIDEEADEETRYSKANVGYASLSLAQIAQKVRNIDDKFREPIRIKTREGATYRFRLPRAVDELMSHKYVDEMYREREKEYANIKLRLKASESVDIEKIKDADRVMEYMDLIEKKENDFFKVRAVQRLIGDGEKDYSSIAEKLEAARDIDLTVWNDLYQVDKKLEFGVDPEVTFYDENTQKEITRRFQFRPVVFVPDLELFNDTGNVVSFGD